MMTVVKWIVVEIHYNSFVSTFFSSTRVGRIESSEVWGHFLHVT